MRVVHFKFRSPLVIATLLISFCLSANSESQEVILQWDSAALQGIRDAKLGAPVVARALAIVHTCMYDAWAAYDERAVGTQLKDALRRPVSERTSSNKEQAISYAAYRALADRAARRYEFGLHSANEAARV